MAKAITSAEIPPDILDMWPDWSREVYFTDSDVLGKWSGATKAKNVAIDVIEVFGLPTKEYNTGMGGLGSLDGIDIKHMPALQAIKESLTEFLAEGAIKEVHVDSDGDVVFLDIGTYNGNITDVYQQVQTSEYKSRVAGAMVTGRKPFPIRELSEWKDVLGTSGILWDTSDMSGNCNKNHFLQYACITYNDPYLVTDPWGDGLDSLFEAVDENNNPDPFKRIVTWAFYLDPGPSYLISSDTDISPSATSSVPLDVSLGKLPSPGLNDEGPNIGNLIRRVPHPEGDFEECWYLSDSYMIDCNSPDVVAVDLPSTLRYKNIRGTTVDQFMKVAQIFVVGIRLDYCLGIPKTVEDALTGISNESNTEIWIASNDPTVNVFRLTEGIHYAVGYTYDEDGGNPRICLQFANNARYGDNAKYGTNVPFKIDPMCHYAKIYNNNSSDVSTYDYTGVGTILPTGGVQGILIKEIWAQIDLASPSIKIYDPAGQAVEIGKNLSFHARAVYIKEPPPPMAFNGKIIDQADQVLDHDPTTKQDFETTALEKVLSEMDSGVGVSINMPTLEEDEVIDMSKFIYDTLKKDSGIYTTYICGPECKPELGGNGLAGGIINEITYSYSDKGSYTITINEGPKFVDNLSGISGSARQKLVEPYSATGTIIQDQGNHTMFKVRVDGYPQPIEAINTTKEFLRVNDRVSVTIHNNPVEI